MKKIKRVSYICVIVLVVSLGLISLAQAHHSTNEYDDSKLVELEGEIVKVIWRNPHVLLHMITQEDGETVTWLLEGNSVSMQVRRGITKDQITVGEKVRVAGYVSTRRDYDMLALHLLLESGQELILRGSRNRPLRWTEASTTKLKDDIDLDKAASTTTKGLFRVWTWGRLERGWWFFGGNDKFPLTDAALAKQADWDEFTDNPQLKCIAPGMPATMGNPYPIKFVKAGDNIEMHAEEYDLMRTIHMGAEADASIPHSHLGYSIGHWEDENTLVVSTANINYPYFNRVGVTQSEDVTTLERFTVDDVEGKLHYELTVTDPWALKEPYQWKALWIWNPDEMVAKYDCAIQ